MGYYGETVSSAIFMVFGRITILTSYNLFLFTLPRIDRVFGRATTAHGWAVDTEWTLATITRSGGMK